MSILPHLSLLVIDYSVTNKKCKSGYFRWGGVNFSKTGQNLCVNEYGKLVGHLVKKDGGLRRGQEIDLDKHIANINGVLKYQ